MGGGVWGGEGRGYRRGEGGVREREIKGGIGGVGGR